MKAFREELREVYTGYTTDNIIGMLEKWLGELKTEFETKNIDDEPKFVFDEIIKRLEKVP